MSGVIKSFYSIKTWYYKKISIKLPSSTNHMGQISTTRNITIRSIGITNKVLSSRLMPLVSYGFIGLFLPISSIIPNKRLISHKLVIALISRVTLHEETAHYIFFNLDLYSSLFGIPEN